MLDDQKWGRTDPMEQADRPHSDRRAGEGDRSRRSSVLPDPRLKALSPTPTMHALSLSEYINYSLFEY